MATTRPLSWKAKEKIKEWAETRFQATPPIPDGLTVDQLESWLRRWLLSIGFPVPRNLRAELERQVLLVEALDEPPPTAEEDLGFDNDGDKYGRRRPKPNGRSAGGRSPGPVGGRRPAGSEEAPPATGRKQTAGPSAQAGAAGPASPASRQASERGRAAGSEPGARQPEGAGKAPAPAAPPRPARRRTGRPLSYHERFMLRIAVWEALGGPDSGALPPDEPGLTADGVDGFIRRWTQGERMQRSDALAPYRTPAPPRTEPKPAVPVRYLSPEELAAERRQRRESRRRQLEEERTERVIRLEQLLPALADIRLEQQQLGLAMAQAYLQRNPAERVAELQEKGQALSAEREALLRAYQIEPQAFEVDWDCPACQNTGWLPGKPVREFGPKEAPVYYPPEKCECLKREELEDMFRAAGLQGPQQEWTFETFTLDVYPAENRPEMERLLQRCRAFAEAVIAGEQRDSLVLMGNPGVGKTHLACAVAHEVIAAKQYVVYFSMTDFLEIARIRSLELTDEARREYVNEILNAPLLILDDVGNEKITDFSIQELTALLNHRLNNGLPLLVTTNLNEEEFQEFYGARVVSRLMNGCEVFQIATEIDVRKVLRMGARLTGRR